MIEGLKATVQGDELRQLCIKQADFHRQRSAFYETKEQALEGVSSQGSVGYSGHRDPRDQMQQKKLEHDNSARTLVFISDHLKPGEEYQLDFNDLATIGIVR
jgi:hypothetical protein